MNLIKLCLLSGLLSILATSLPAQSAADIAASLMQQSPDESLQLQNSNLASAEPEFLHVSEAFKPEAIQEGTRLRLSWAIAEGYYLYADKIKISHASSGAPIAPLEFTRPGKIKQDEYFGAVEVYYHDLTVFVSPVTSGQQDIELKISYQGCADAGLCYPPETFTAPFLAMQASAQPESGAQPVQQPAQQPTMPLALPAGNDAAPDTDSASGIFAFLANSGTAFILLIFFLLGTGLAFTPCVFPMIPILSSIIAGQDNLTVRKGTVLASSYVVGMATTYAAAGVLVGSLGAGANLQAYMQNPWVLTSFGAVFVILSLAMFGFYELQLPAFLRDRLNQANAGSQGGSVAGAGVMGMLSALVVSPCVSAPLAGALLYISTTGDALLGGLALLAMGLGMGTPLIAIGAGGSSLLPRAGAWMEAVKVFFGVTLLGVAIWLLERILPPALVLALWAGLLGIYAVYLGAFDQVASNWTGWRKFRKGLGLLLFTYAAILLTGASSGASDPLRPLGMLIADTSSVTVKQTSFQTVTTPEALQGLLKSAKSAQKPVMIDFYADWCISCKVMERNVLSDARVQKTLANHVLIKADVTTTTEHSAQLLKSYGIFGPPAYIFIDAAGQEVESHRMMGEKDVESFLQHLATL